MRCHFNSTRAPLARRAADVIEESYDDDDDDYDAAALVFFSDLKLFGVCAWLQDRDAILLTLKYGWYKVRFGGRWEHLREMKYLRCVESMFNLFILQVYNSYAR